MTDANVTPIPFARLFGMAFNQLVDDLHDRLRAEGWNDVRRSYGFVLLAVRHRDLSTTELAEVLRVTKQAASLQVAAMEAAGYVAHRRSPTDGRVRLVSLANRGRRLLDEVETIYATLEAQWEATVGVDAIETMRATLITLLGDDAGNLPTLRAP